MKSNSILKISWHFPLYKNITEKRSDDANSMAAKVIQHAKITTPSPEYNSENPIETMNSTCDYPIANTILSVSCNLEHYNISDQLQVAIVHVLNYLNVNLENNQNMWLKCLNLSGATYILHQEEIHWYEQAPIIQVSFNVAKFRRWASLKTLSTQSFASRWELWST